MSIVILHIIKSAPIACRQQSGGKYPPGPFSREISMLLMRRRMISLQWLVFLKTGRRRRKNMRDVRRFCLCSRGLDRAKYRPRTRNRAFFLGDMEQSISCTYTPKGHTRILLTVMTVSLKQLINCSFLHNCFFSYRFPLSYR